MSQNLNKDLQRQGAMEIMNENLREDMSEIIYNNVSPNIELCKTVELLEKSSSTMDKKLYRGLMSNLQSVFMSNLESALKITNVRNVDAIEYEDWVLAADSFMLGKYDVIAKSLEVRSQIGKEKDVALYNYISVNMGNNIKPLIEKLVSSDVSSARNRIAGLEMLLSDNFLNNVKNDTEGYKENLDYAKKCVSNISKNDVKVVFENGIEEIEKINNLMQKEVVAPLRKMKMGS